MITTALFLSPLDQLFFRDGRAFGASTRVVSGLPNPATLTGALRTLLLNNYKADFGKLARTARHRVPMHQAFREAGAPEWIADIRVRGPWLAKQDRQIEAFLPAPRHLRPGPAEARLRAQPLRTPLPGWNESQKGSPDRKPLWCAGAVQEKGRGAGELIHSTRLSECLQSDRPLPKDAFLDSGKLYSLQDKTGIAIDEQKLTAKESMIYAVRMLCLAPAIGFYCEIQSPQPLGISKPVLFPFGGESRYVRATPVEPLKWPPSVQSERRMLYLLSPGLFANCEIPDRAPEGAKLISASVDGSFAVSGWDLARGGPKPARFGVQSGSVYFYEGGAAFSEQSLCADSADALSGYGDYLQGVWNYV